MFSSCYVARSKGSSASSEDKVKLLKNCCRGLVGFLFTQVGQLLELLSGPCGLSLHSGGTAVSIAVGASWAFSQSGETAVRISVG